CLVLSSSNRKGAAAHGALQDLLQDGVPADPPGLQRDRLQVFQDRAIPYLKYLQIFRSLEEVYEQPVQPQKRRGVRTVLDGLMGRLLELKAQMVELELSELRYFDYLLLDLKMTPELITAGLRLIQDQNEEEYQRPRLSVKQSVLDAEGTDMKEALQEHIRQWFMKCRDATGTFPDFPDVQDGGSASPFAQKAPQQVSALLAAREEEREKKKKRETETCGVAVTTVSRLLTFSCSKRRSDRKWNRKSNSRFRLWVRSTLLSSAGGRADEGGAKEPQTEKKKTKKRKQKSQGSQAVLDKIPVVKTLLLAGPSGVGKKMLVQAVYNETGAHPFNLSHRYPDRGGVAYLRHLVFKVAGELQPSVIWIEDAEKTFYEKTMKSNREFDPRRMKRDLLRCLKTLRPEDRVLVIGTTQTPFDGEIKAFCEVYKKIIPIPKSDYGSRMGTSSSRLQSPINQLIPDWIRSPFWVQ
ncbi:dynein regulatory complex protein 11-like, partial [Xiphias gladius]|uniref:dynein regulatory complex protein 11-like n=1 Tax=Xiphias gladius TaxID=8245 RepID=UPI001A990AFA